MAVYVFNCPGREHEGEREFEQFIHQIPKVIITQLKCPQCGAIAKRCIDKEIQTQALIGQTQISHASTVKGTVAHDLKFAFGETRENPDGTVDANHRPFTTTGELDKFMAGRNNLGPRIVDNDGNPIKDSRGNYVHGGAKLVKLGKGAAPSRNDVRKGPRKYKNADHVGAKDIGAFPNTRSSALRG